MRFLDYIKELLFYSLEKKPSAVSQYQTLMISSALFLMCVCVGGGDSSTQLHFNFTVNLKTIKQFREVLVYASKKNRESHFQLSFILIFYIIIHF